MPDRTIASEVIRAFIREHGIVHLFDDMLGALLQQRPDNVRVFLAAWLMTGDRGCPIDVARACLAPGCQGPPPSPQDLQTIVEKCTPRDLCVLVDCIALRVQKSMEKVPVAHARWDEAAAHWQGLQERLLSTCVAISAPNRAKFPEPGAGGPESAGSPSPPLARFDGKTVHAVICAQGSGSTCWTDQHTASHPGALGTQSRSDRSYAAAHGAALGAEREQRVASLRACLQKAQQVVCGVQDSLGQLLKARAVTSRAGYLRSLHELVGPVPAWSWQEEWQHLWFERSGATTSVAQMKDLWKSKIGALLDRGWTQDSAETYQLLSVCAKPMGRALRQCDPCYAASTYALVQALLSMQGQIAVDTPTGLPPRLYTHRYGKFSLSERDPAWGALEVPDCNGFCGLTSMALIKCTAEPQFFTEKGFAVDCTAPGGHVEHQVQPGDIVGIDSHPEDEHGLHAAVLTTSADSGAFPPNTLFRLKEVIPPGQWEAPGGVCPQQRLLVVTATYRIPHSSIANAASGGKLCSSPVMLHYGDKQAYVQGIDDLITRPMLAMAQEFNREGAWTDEEGVTYTLCEEWDYVTRVVERKAEGKRDINNIGKTPSDFQQQVNAFIQSRRESGHGTSLAEADAFLTLDEVIAVRLYSGPAYQPINCFLRQVAALTGDFRAHLAQSPMLTFAATVGHICCAIRKLAAVTTPEEAAAPLWRGVRGELPKAFWMPDDLGMVVAVDMGFMSTSRDRETPIAFMGSGANVLWELQPQQESDAAYHCGADIAMLSQYTGEKEVLYPPCTMLRVVLNPTKALAPLPQCETGSEVQAASTGAQGSGVWQTSESDKTILSIRVVPYFL